VVAVVAAQTFWLVIIVVVVVVEGGHAEEVPAAWTPVCACQVVNVPIVGPLQNLPHVGLVVG